jgi:hypothetical protein
VSGPGRGAAEAAPLFEAEEDVEVEAERTFASRDLTDDDLLDFESALDDEAYGMLGRFECQRARWGAD